MKISSYKELIAYQKGMQLVKVIYMLTKKFPKDELYGLTSQMRRAGISIPSNIAEGYMRGSREYIHFLKIALGSCAELETQLELSKEVGICDLSDFNELYELNTEITKLLITYIKKMEGRS